MKRLQGVAAAPGMVHGPWVRIDPTPVPAGGRIPPQAAHREIERLREASEAAAKELEAIAGRVEADGHADEGAIFLAQASIARDPALIAMADGRINESGEDGVAAILAAAGSFAEQLRSLDDDLLAARAADVLDVGQRIARRLTGTVDPAGEPLDRPAIIVADDLPPSVTATLPRERILGIALEGSSPTAHAAILARAYGIPAVVGTALLLATLKAEEETKRAGELAINGETGEIIVDPDETARTRFDAGAEDERRRREADLLEATQPAVTLDGVEIALLANIGTPDESDGAVALGAAGVGLFRTEFLFLERTSPPSEAEQLAAYERVVRAFAPHQVTIRLLDVGGDKPIPYLPIGDESNPFLGVRALRLAYTDPSLFVTQLRACYRAATAGPLKVMAPMVVDADDVDLLLSLAQRARDELAAENRAMGEVALGVMLEIPSSILVGDSYFGQIAFASLGTNDLLQYTVAVDRTNANLERYRDSLHPSVLRLIRLSVETAERAGIELSVCGEMAGDPAAALALVGLGIRSLSMASSSLPAVRRAIRGVRLADLESAVTAGLVDRSATAVRTRFGAQLAKVAQPRSVTPDQLACDSPSPEEIRPTRASIAATSSGPSATSRIR
jgi:phosphoenolpyruvate-protein phosphotransferase